MNIRLIVADSESNAQLEIQNLVDEISITTTILDQPGTMIFRMLEDSIQHFYEGSNVILSDGDKQIFNGYVFTRERNDSKFMQVTCYDRIRYLSSSDTYVFANHSATEVFSIICGDHQLPFRVVHGSDWKTAPVVHDNKSLYSMITRACEENLIANNQYLMVRDNSGTLELVDVADLTTNVLIGDASLLTGYNFKGDINESTYNYVKLIHEDKDSGDRSMYIAQDSSTIYKWGRLQYFENVDESLTPEQIQDRALKLLNLYNRKTKTLRVSSLGDWSVSAGSGVGVAIKALENENIAYMQYTFASTVTHKIKNQVHTMDLNLEVV